ncbi:MAG TPA: FAD:protein FMN transferase [Rubrivivax sp.]|nr:FAD:protein FMN transferase [Rubrivivax sp.]
MPKTSSEAARQAHDGGLRRLKLHGPTMGARWSVSADVGSQLDAQALQQGLQQALADAVAQVDAQMSPWKPESDLQRFNRAPVGEWVPLPAQMLQVLQRALQVCRQSEGAFDPGVGELVDAWGFGAVRDAPDAQAIRAARQAERRPTHERLELDMAAGRARKQAPLQLDLCGIAKGYGVDRMVEVLQQHGVAHALAALDGELRALGCQGCSQGGSQCGSQGDGKPWAVAVESPMPGRRSAQGVIELQDLAVATSGDYRRFVELGGVRLAHTMDARRGGPVRNSLAAVTVLAADCMSADAWATALLVAGPAAGLAMAQRAGLEALFVERRGGRWIETGLGRFGKDLDQAEGVDLSAHERHRSCPKREC